MSELGVRSCAHPYGVIDALCGVCITKCAGRRGLHRLCCHLLASLRRLLNCRLTRNRARGLRPTLPPLGPLAEEPEDHRQTRPEDELSAKRREPKVPQQSCWKLSRGRAGRE